QPPATRAAATSTRRPGSARRTGVTTSLRGRPGARGSQLRHRFVARRVDREDPVEAGDLEDLGDVAVAADERELPAVRAEPLHAADEHAEGRGVDEGGAAEVDDDLLAALADDLEQLLLERRDRLPVGAERLLVESADGRVEPLRAGLLDRVGADGLAERPAGLDHLARSRELLLGGSALILRGEGLRQRELKPGHLAPRLHVLGLQLGVLLQRRDGLVRLSVGLVRGGEVAVGLRALRILLNLLLRLRDGR